MADALKTGEFNAMTNQSRSLSLWMPRVQSSDRDTFRHRDVATGRARQLVATQAFARNALQIHRNNVVGPTFRLALKPMWQRLGITLDQADEWCTLIEQEFEGYANAPGFDSDAMRVQTFPWQVQQAYATMWVSGEALGVLKWKEGPAGYNTCVLTVEPERLSQPPDKSESAQFRYGVETDKDGAPVAYWIRNAHETDQYFNVETSKWSRVARYRRWGRPQVLHLIDRARPDMRRGISHLLAAIETLKLSDEYDRAEVEAAVLKTELPNQQALALMGAVSNADMGDMSAAAGNSVKYMAGVAPWHKEQNVTVNGARALHLLPGESLELTNPNHAGLSFEAFQKVATRKIAAALGVSNEQLTRDFGEMSFASAKQSLGDIWRGFYANREMLVRQWAIPHADAWLEEAIDTQRVPMPNGKKGDMIAYREIAHLIWAKSTFISWGPPQVDPVKENEGKKLAIGIGTSTLQDEAQETGGDWRENLEQQARERKLKEKLGLPQLEEIDAPPPAPPGEDGPPAKKAAAKKK